MYCLNCGKQIPEDAEFCPFCGGKIKREEDLIGEVSFTSNLQYPQSNIPSNIPTGNEKGPKQRRIPKWGLIVLSITGCLIILLIAWIGIRSAKKISDNKTPFDVRVSVPSKESFAAQTSTASKKSVQETTQKTAKESEAVKPKEGEYLYVGNTSYFDIDDLELSFILSADKTFIHDVSIQVTNLNTSVTTGNMRTDLSVSKSTQMFPGSYAIDFNGTTTNIWLGQSKIISLYFDGGTAHMELDYTYVHNSAGIASQKTEIPFGSTWIDLYAEDYIEVTEPTLAEATTSETTKANTPTATTTDITYTEFDWDILKNWNDQAMQETYGIDSLFNFTPNNPQPMHYIVSTDGVYDPVTGTESEGGYIHDYVRHFPISTDDLIRRAGKLKDSGLTLTDDPNQATFALVLHFSYTDNIGTFRFADGSIISQYHGNLWADLVNLVTGEVIQSDVKNAYATYTNESVYTSMLNAAKGKQLYSDTPSLYAEDFEGYWNFVKK
ncbi:MAG TPA: zinc ribbon domain-containing protein [Clostridiaceae bacterium]|nr:zinc ribbon domain-containing protein [Clostridiaceae bacterium]